MKFLLFVAHTGSNPVDATKDRDVTSSVFETVICNGVENVGSSPIIPSNLVINNGNYMAL